MAFRRLVEVQFVHFWGLVAKWLSGGLWRLILCVSRARWLNGSQEACGGLFCAFLQGLSDFLAIYVRMSIGFVNLRVYRQGMCQIFSLFTLE